MKHILPRGLVLGLAFLFYLNLNGQVTFQKTFGGSGDEVANWVANTATGYIVAGYTTVGNSRDGYLLNLDFSGNVIWQKTIGGTQDDIFNVVLETSDGFLALGETTSLGAGAKDILLVKLNAAGDEIWSKTIGVSGTEDQGLAMMELPDKRILISGAQAPTFTTEFSTSFYLLDENGESIWSRNYVSSISNLLRTHYVNNGIIYASGGGDADGAFVRIDLETGNLLNVVRYNGTITEALYYQQPTQDGNLLLADHTWSAGGVLKQWVKKVTPEGVTLWSKVYSRPNGNFRGRIEAAGNDNFLLTPYDGLFTANADPIMIKIDGEGNVIWSRNFGKPGADWFWKAQMTPDGGFIAVGTTTGANQDREILIVKTNADGLVEGCCVPSVDMTVENFDEGQGSFVLIAADAVSSADASTTPFDVFLQENTFCGQNPVTSSVDIALCPNESVTIDSVAYFAPDTVEQVFAGVFGCDSIVTYTLNLLPQPTRDENIQICAGDTIFIGGQAYTESATVTDTIAASSGCDTIVTYTLSVLPLLTKFENVSFCAGDSVSIAGQTYTEAGIVVVTIPGTSGCDTTVTYTLTVLPQISGAETITFCAGDTILIDGQFYTEAGTVSSTFTAANGCDSIVTYTLELLPQPALNETITLCPGDSVLLNGQTYTQPGIVAFTIPANSGCDTLVTYTLVSALPAPSVVNITCPNNISIIAEPGTAPIVVDYNLPTANSNCPCPGLSLELTSGLPSGAAFPNGITEVCYSAQDSCEHSASCCFTVTIREVQPCDVKVNGCMRYELLTITADAAQNLTYRVRVINNCANKLIYTAIQLPNGVVAMEPANLSTFTSEGGIEYEVRNPNFSPFYSIRYKTTNDSISGGESDIFEYTLPAQSKPLFMNITSRLAPQIFYEAHLNTFYCPIGVTEDKGTSEERGAEKTSQRPSVFPSPTEGTFWVNLAGWTGKNPTWRIFNAQGQQILTNTAAGEDRLLQVTLPQSISNGLYFFEIRAENGEKETLRFMLQRN